MKPTPSEVIQTVTDLLFTLDERKACGPDRDFPEDAVVVTGLMNSFAYHPGRLAAAKPKIATMLRELPLQFFDQKGGGGGGWSFLNMCKTKDDELWTGMHAIMDDLLCLGLATGLAEFCLPKREDWVLLPGGMPYVVLHRLEGE
jgi:hypothetical protein